MRTVSAAVIAEVRKYLTEIEEQLVRADEMRRRLEAVEQAFGSHTKHLDQATLRDLMERQDQLRQQARRA